MCRVMSFAAVWFVPQRCDSGLGRRLPSPGPQGYQPPTTTNEHSTQCYKTSWTSSISEVAQLTETTLRNCISLVFGLFAFGHPQNLGRYGFESTTTWLSCLFLFLFFKNPFLHYSNPLLPNLLHLLLFYVMLRYIPPFTFPQHKICS